MGVIHYEWGVGKGGTSPDGPTIPDEASYGKPEQFEYTLGAAVQTVNFTNYTKSVTIRNNSDTVSIEYNLDSEWFLMGPYGSITEPVSINSLQLRRVGAGNPEVEITGVLKS